MMQIVTRSGRGLKPLILKLGLALTLSVAGYVVAHLRFRRRLPPAPCPSTSKQEGDKATPRVGLKEELWILGSDEGLATIINGTSTTTITTTKTVVNLSPRSTGDDEGFLLPEFNELVLKEFELSSKDPEITTTPKSHRSCTRDDISSMEQEISQLRDLVLSLRERERSLELQLLEYYGLQEREAAVKELESQLKLSTMEAKLFNVKIESLQAENQRLQNQVLDHSRVSNELEAAKAKLKALKKRIKLDGEQAREKIAALHQMIAVLQDREQKEERDSSEAETKLKRLHELEEGASNLAEEKSILVQENLALKRKLDSLHNLSSCVVERSKAEDLEEIQQLKQSNDKLLKEIEQLRMDHCSDVEELVYLRWVNACLRYELRNYQPPKGKTAARDLSKNLSPTSEQKAKQLILEYASSGVDEKAMSPGDIDEYSSHTTGESDEAFLDPCTNPKHSSRKSKFFSKLKKLVLGKDKHNRTVSVDRTPPGVGTSDRRASFSNSPSTEYAAARHSCDSFSSSMTEDVEMQVDEQCSSKHGRCKRPSLDLQRLRRINVELREVKGSSCKREVEEGSCSLKSTACEEESPLGSKHSTAAFQEGNHTPEKAELRRYAEVLMGSCGPQKVTRKCKSFSPR